MSAAVFGQVVSANVVGYANCDTIEEDGFTYWTAPFLKVGQKSISIDDIQMPADCAFGEADIQLLDKDGGSAAVYTWIDAEFATSKGLVFPGANGCWCTYEGKGAKRVYTKVDYTFNPGEGFQLSSMANTKISFSGEVSDADIEDKTLIEEDGFSYLGNPYPVELSIDNIQMPVDCAFGEADIQLLDKDGGSAAVYTWIDAEFATSKGLVFPGANGCWCTYEGKGAKRVYTKVDYALQPGQGFQLSSPGGSKVSIYAPFEL